MATSPVTPSLITTLTPAFLQHWITFVKAHEKLLIVALAGFLVYHISTKGIDAWVAHDTAKSNAAAITVKTDTTVTDALKSQIETLQSTVASQNATMLAAIAATQKSVKNAQNSDATLSQADLAARIAKLVNIPQQDIVPDTTTHNLDLTQTGAVSVAQQLELVPALQSEVESLNTIVTNDTTVIAGQNNLIAQLNKDVTDAKAQDVQDVKTLKAQNKKSFLHGLKVGAIGGFIAGVFVGHSI
jgi:hypothetical protein